MNGSKFDEFSKQLARAGSRRQFFKTLVAGVVVAPLLSHFGRDAFQGVRNPGPCHKNPCGKGLKCCVVNPSIGSHSCCAEHSVCCNGGLSCCP